MKKLSFLNKISNYFTNPQYYLSTTFQPIGENIKMLLLVLLILATSWSTVKSARDIPVAIDYIQRLSEDVIQHYPNDLKFSWNNDSLSYSTQTNDSATTPLIIPFSSVLPELPDTLPNNFAFITNSADNPESLDIKPTEYLLFINSQEIYTVSDIANSTWQSTKLTELLQDVDSVTVTKADFSFITELVLKFITENQTMIKVGYLLLLIPFFIASKLWILLVESIFVILLFKIYSMKLTVKQTLSLTISVFIPTSIIATLANILYGPLSFPLNTVAFWIVLLFILYSLKNTSMVKIKSSEKN